MIYRPGTKSFHLVTIAEWSKLDQDASLRFTFGTATDATSIADGDLRLNNATPTSATIIYVEETALAALDAAAALALYGATDRLRLEPVNGDGSIFLDARITSNVDSGAYRTITINTVTGNGAFTASMPVTLKLYKGASVPTPAGSGTFKLQSIDGVLTWVSDT